MPDTTASELPKGLFWRGKTLWISKVINGRRHQFSTKCHDVDAGLEVFRDFLAKQGVSEAPKKDAGSRPKLPRGLYWKGNVIWLSKSVNGKRYNISTGTSEPKLAEKLLADFKLRAFKGEKLGCFTRAKLTFEQLAGRYLEQCKVDGLKSRTLARYNAIVAHFVHFLQIKGMADANVDRIDAAEIEDYKVWRSTTPLNRNGWPVTEKEEASSSGAAPKTIQTELQTIGTFFKYGLRLRLVEDNPVSRVRTIRAPRERVVYLDEKEIGELLEAAKTYDMWARGQKFGTLLHDILLTYLKTGMRLDELRHLEWSDVDLSRNEIHIRGNKFISSQRKVVLPESVLARLRKMSPAKFEKLRVNEKLALLKCRELSTEEAAGVRLSDIDLRRGSVLVKSEIKWSPKTKGHTIPISPALRPVLAAQQRESNFVFPHPNTLGIWRFKINRLVKRCSSHAEIAKDIHTHTLRHTFATHLRRNGVALETIKELLGHSDIRDTLIYAHFSPEEARQAIPKIDFF